MATEVTSANFGAEVLNAETPVLVDFWSVTCMPCQMLSPVIEELAQQAKDYKVCKLCVDNEPELTAQYGIMVVPTLIAFKGGQPVDQLVGLHPQEAFEDMMRRAL